MQVHIRITAVPIKIDVGQIGELVSTSGIVVRMSQPTVMKMKKRFNCRKCKLSKKKKIANYNQRIMNITISLNFFSWNGKNNHLGISNIVNHVILKV